jgi:hypothetical protein
MGCTPRRRTRSKSLRTYSTLETASLLEVELQQDLTSAFLYHQHQLEDRIFLILAPLVGARNELEDETTPYASVPHGQTPT